MAGSAKQPEAHAVGGVRPGARRYLSDEELGPLALDSEEPPAGSAGAEAAAAAPGGPREDPGPVSGEVHEASGLHDELIREEMRRLAYSGRYELRDVVAKGAESVLYRAVAGPAVFCVKAIRGGMARIFGMGPPRHSEGKVRVPYRTKVRHILNEFEVGTALQQRDRHPPLVRIYALRKVRWCGVQVGYDLLMELFEGTDMSDRKFLRTLSRVDKLRVLYHTAQALQFMHRHCYVHMDMKPSNIMVVDGSVKLIDFGVTANIGHVSHAVTGTSGFLSPEQIAREAVNEATDMFSLGVTFGVIFGGRPLHQSQAELRSKQFRKEAAYHLAGVTQPMITDIPELVSLPEVSELLSECTIPKREKRLANGEALLTRLRQIAADRDLPLESNDGV